MTEAEEVAGQVLTMGSTSRIRAALRQHTLRLAPELATLLPPS